MFCSLRKKVVLSICLTALVCTSIVSSAEPVACMAYNTSNSSFLNSIRTLEDTGNDDINEFYQLFVPELANMTNQSVLLTLYDDRSSPNAIAYSGPYRGKKYAIFMGKRLSNELPIDVKTPHGIATSFGALGAVLMHEFAHLTQYDQKLHRKNSVRDLELLSDVMSGWYIAWANNKNESQGMSKKESRTLAKHAADQMFRMGDYKFNDPNHHGTPGQRESAFKQGYQLFGDGYRNYFSAFEKAKRIRGIKG